MDQPLQLLAIITYIDEYSTPPPRLFLTLFTTPSHRILSVCVWWNSVTSGSQKRPAKLFLGSFVSLWFVSFSCVTLIPSFLLSVCLSVSYCFCFADIRSDFLPVLFCWQIWPIVRSSGLLGSLKEIHQDLAWPANSQVSSFILFYFVDLFSSGELSSSLWFGSSWP